ncbi:MAG: hypothetical protein HYT27_00995 [Parcubacteria group bacterium]|nr:hypothetical protein [Parcubacteria group bacterium]
MITRNVVALKKRQKQILKALLDLGGKATTRQIAEKTNLHVNGVSQSLDAIAYQNSDLVYLGGKGGDTLWQLKHP